MDFFTAANKTDTLDELEKKIDKLRTEYSGYFLNNNNIAETNKIIDGINSSVGNNNTEKIKDFLKSKGIVKDVGNNNNLTKGRIINKYDLLFNMIVTKIKELEPLTTNNGGKKTRKRRRIFTKRRRVVKKKINYKKSYKK
jgi:BioD-like phosphotransacetylase family protein